MLIEQTTNEQEKRPSLIEQTTNKRLFEQQANKPGACMHGPRAHNRRVSPNVNYATLYAAPGDLAGEIGISGALQQHHIDVGTWGRWSRS